MFTLVHVWSHIEPLFICVVTEPTIQQIVEDVEHQTNFEFDSYLLFRPSINPARPPSKPLTVPRGMLSDAANADTIDLLVIRPTAASPERVNVPSELISAT